MSKTDSVSRTFVDSAAHGAVSQKELEAQSLNQHDTEVYKDVYDYLWTINVFFKIKKCSKCMEWMHDLQHSNERGKSNTEI